LSSIDETSSIHRSIARIVRTARARRVARKSPRETTAARREVPKKTSPLAKLDFSKQTQQKQNVRARKKKRV